MYQTDIVACDNDDIVACDTIVVCVIIMSLCRKKLEKILWKP